MCMYMCINTYIHIYIYMYKANLAYINKAKLG